MSSQLTLANSGERLTPIYEDKEEQNVPNLKINIEENISRIRSCTFSEPESSKNPDRSSPENRYSTVGEGSPLRRLSRTLNVRNPQELEKFGPVTILRQNSGPDRSESPRGRKENRDKPIGAFAGESKSPSSIFEPRRRKKSKDLSIGEKTLTPTPEGIRTGNSSPRSLSSSMGARNKVLRRSPQTRDVPGLEPHPLLIKEHINEKRYAITNLLNRLSEACDHHQFTKTLLFGREIANHLVFLEKVKSDLENTCDEFKAISQLISSCTANTFYQQYTTHKMEIDKQVNSEINNRKFADFILALNNEDKQTRTKEVYINAILERAVSHCPSLLSLIRTNRQLYQSASEIFKRFNKLFKYAKKLGVPDEFLYYCSRILQELDILRTITFDPGENLNVLSEGEVNNTPLSCLKTLSGVLESELLAIQEQQAAKLSIEISELKDLHGIIKNLNLNPNHKLHISDNGSSLEVTNKKGKSKRFSGTSYNAHLAMDFILDKISKNLSPNPKTNRLISDIIHLIDNNSWMNDILKHESNRELFAKFINIKKSLSKSYSLTPNHDTYTHAEFWEALLDTDSTFHKKFITCHHKFSGFLSDNPDISPTKQLFLVLNEKFAKVEPFQQKQILQLALYWLQSPLQIGLRNPQLPEKIDSMQLMQARPLIMSLIAQVKDHRCLALYDLASQLKKALKNCLPSILIKPDLMHAKSPMSLFKSIADGVCKGTLYEKAVADISNTLRTLCMYDFLSITDEDLLKPPSPNEHKTSIARLIKYSSFLSYWVLESIFRTSDEIKKIDLKGTGPKETIVKRSNRSIERMIEFFIDVCSNLVDEKNACRSSPADYHSAFAVFVILSKPFVEKLFIGSKSLLKISQEHLAKFQALATLFAANNTFYNLRKKYDEVLCHIPAINFICRDLTTSLDPELVPIMHEEKINLTAIDKIGKSTMAISRSQAALDYVNACVFNLPAEFYRIKNTQGYFDVSNQFDDHIFDNVFYSIAQGLGPG